MKKNEKKNVGPSIFQRLLNRAREKREDFNLLLSRFGMERFLYRLSISPFVDRFVLKGASLFLIWKGQNFCVTRDADLLGFGNPNLEVIAETFCKICDIDFSQHDGMLYLQKSLKVEAIREDQEYDGVRVTLVGLLNQARIPLQIDIGFGNSITPPPEIVEYPTLFDHPIPKIKAYSVYTVVAEKLEAMIKLGISNNRMKDFFDIWLLSKLFKFEGKILGDAIKNTFNRRHTLLPETVPFAFTASFFDDQQKQTQWKAFVKKSKPDLPVGDLVTVILEISEFIIPVIKSLKTEMILEKDWSPGKGWKNMITQDVSAS
ncbi:MAG: nucleotidyl transferase AbiEii/AbiGii toxin family protein [Candidatus Riflebacteria bacterium]|nr:nucleotidyl transferase AbiEii/AbiGii toxin family protein [Candidatus Riflebacteria bacterium]